MTQYKRLTLCLMTLVVLSFIVGTFFCYHFMLAMMNQTTNERYKWHYYQLALDKKNKENADGSGDSKDIPPAKPSINIYDRGIWRNLLEELFPLQSSRELAGKKRS